MKDVLSVMGPYLRQRPVLWVAGLVLPPLFSLTVQLIYARANQEVVARLEGQTATRAAVLLILGAAFVGMVVAEALHRVTRYLRVHFATLTEGDLRQTLYEALLRRRWRDLTGMHTGDLFTRYNEDAPIAVAAVSEDLCAMVYPLIMGLGTCAAIFLTHPLLGALAGFLMVMVSLLNWHYTRRYQAIETERRARQEAFTLEVDGVLQGKMTVRMMSLAARMSEALGRSSARIADSERDAARLTLQRALTLEVFASLCATMMLPIAALMAALAWIQLPQVIFVAQLGGTLIATTQSFGLAVTAFGRDMVSVRRLKRFLDQPGEPTEQGHALNAGGAREVLALQTVSLAYEGKQILEHASMRVHVGEIVALVGASGCGKSSLAKAILGLADYTGQIRLWGTDIRDCTLSSLRAAIAYVPEHNDLIDGTLVENVGLGRPGADSASIRRTMTQAALDEFLERDGIVDREVGARGSSLSGGQRQRVALARAFLKDAPLLILDEPIASLDSASEALVLDSLRAMRDTGKSVLLITHRAATLQIADRIVMVEEGSLRCDVPFAGAVERLTRDGVGQPVPVA